MNGTRTRRTIALLVAAAALALPAAAAAQEAEPQLAADPWDGLVWDFVPVGDTGEVKYATLSNPGTVDNAIERVEIVGRNPADFQLASDECTAKVLPPGGSCRVGVRFVPRSSTGTRVAHLYVTDSSACPLWLDLAGSATEASRSPHARAAGCNPPRTTNVTVTNVDNQQPLQPAPKEIVAFPRRCSSRRVIRIRVFAPRGTTLRSVRATLNGKPIEVRKVKGRFRATIDLRGRPRGVNTVRLHLLATNGRRYFGKRVYRTCGTRKGVGTPRY